MSQDAQQDSPALPRREVPFSPPDIGEEEIAAVGRVLRSGWITTGPETKRFEAELADFTGAAGAACLSSATAAMECALRALGIGPGDEVVTSAYTYTASASPILHVGATPVLCDVAPGSFEMDYAALPALVTERTKAVVPVDLGGMMCDYAALCAALDTVRDRWRPAAGIQSCFDRPVVIADAAHALGASRDGARCGEAADLTAFSFHAVKNLTTAEGGALAWRRGLGDRPARVPGTEPSAGAAYECPVADGILDLDALYHHMMLLSLHGQSKDALAKDRAGAWEYDIEFPGWKCNMTDIMAAIGRVQLARYPGMLERRRALVARYEAGLADLPVTTAPHYGDGRSSSGHLMFVLLDGRDAAFRNALVERMAAKGVAANVHYKPLPLLSAYAKLGFDVRDFPNAYALFDREITLPLNTVMTDEDADYVLEVFRRAYRELADGTGDAQSQAAPAPAQVAQAAQAALAPADAAPAAQAAQAGAACGNAASGTASCASGAAPSADSNKDA